MVHSFEFSLSIVDELIFVFKEDYVIDFKSIYRVFDFLFDKIHQVAFRIGDYEFFVKTSMRRNSQESKYSFTNLVYFFMEGIKIFIVDLEKVRMPHPSFLEIFI